MSSKFKIFRSDNGGCLLCQKDDQELYLAREVKGGRLIAICACCLLLDLDSYLIDNTCKWPIICKR